MTPALIVSVIWLAFMAALIWMALAFKRRRRRGLGAGAIGAVHHLLNEDKQNAVAIIVEKRAEATDPEDADGNLPDLENPRR